MRLADNDLSRAKKIAALFPRVEAHHVDLNVPSSIDLILRGSNAALSALPFYCNRVVAAAAVRHRVHYFDLTEDVETTKYVTKLAKKAPCVLMPQCGLAPGFISIAAAHLATQFQTLNSLKLRVGALPVYPSNRLKYNLTWSTEGLINEYGNPCEVIHNGKKTAALPLEGLEVFSLDGVEYEAFNTSGGLGTLCETMKGRVKTLNYKTIRYPGHRDLIAFLMLDLKFNEDRATLARVFERSLGITPQDKCIILAEATGLINGVLTQKTYTSTIYSTEFNKHHLSAIQLTTASGICTPLDLVLTGALGTRRKGLVTAEEIPLELFLSNEFGSYYRS